MRILYQFELLRPLKIYLGDLTYDTISLSTEAFPLNIGFISSYAISRFGNDVDITLFKYIDELDKAINDSPPDILGLSNYVWCQRVDIEMFRMLLKNNPYALTVMGGPNFPLDPPSQKKFLDKYPEVDIYVPVEGEAGFVNIVERALKADSKESIKKTILSAPIDNCISRGLSGKLQYGNFVGSRIKKLDEIPSPYSTGILDKFFDGRLTPMLQTNRGCPFTCSFCVDGTDLVNQVNGFSLERVFSDLRYIAEHVPEKAHSLFISDLNFGMIPRDQEICNYIAEIQKKYEYPKEIHSTTGKNNKEKIIQNIKSLKGALKLWMSVQSMDQEVLANIRRANISVEHALALAPAIKESGLRTFSEVILGLPGDSYESHINTLRQLFRAKMDNILVYSCMMLPGSELNTPEERRRWGFKTKYRVLTRDFTKLSNGKKVIEIEEIVVGSNTLTFNEYVELRVLAFLIFVTNMGVVYDPILKLLREQDVDIFELFYRMLIDINQVPSTIRNIVDKYRQATMNELWDSPEKIETHYQDEKEYQKLLNGEEGINVLQFHHAIVVSEYMDDWTNYVLSISHDLLKEKSNFTEELEHQFRAIAKYCRGISHNILGEDRMLTNPEPSFNFDVLSWLVDLKNSPLINFKLNVPTVVSFQFTEEQSKMIEDKLEIFGNTTAGRSQVIKRMPITMLWRKPVILKTH